ncbi:DMT family transporter [Dokdonella ginsengisoli]|uniref:DMT family transporter n=1 Tax=Dokdonella ginsengisoli TaxID=363846 RepID=A0ABV9QR02_9GAMM
MNLPFRQSPAVLPLFAAGLALVFWSSAFAAIAYGLRAFSPAELSLLRFGIASAVLAIPVALGAIRLPPRRDWPAVAVLALIGMTVYQLSLGYAMTRIPAGAAAVIIALAPGVTSALAALRLGETLTARMGVGLAVAFAGVVLVTLGSGRELRFEPMALLVLVAVFATSVYFVWQKPLLARTDALGFTTASIFAATLGLLPFGLHLPEKIALASTAQLVSAAYLGLVPTVFGYVCWNWALSRASASTVSSFLYVQPLLAGLIAWLWLGQTLGALAVAGGALAIGGVVLTIRGSRASSPPPLPRDERAACAG